jgi:chromosome segregation ATPase
MTQHNQARLVELQQRLNLLQDETHRLSQQAAMWRQRVVELEQSLGQRKAESERWRQLAHDTVEKLWNFGRSMSCDEGTPSLPTSSLSKAL